MISELHSGFPRRFCWSIWWLETADCTESQFFEEMEPTRKKQLMIPSQKLGCLGQRTVPCCSRGIFGKALLPSSQHREALCSHWRRHRRHRHRQRATLRHILNREDLWILFRIKHLGVLLNNDESMVCVHFFKEYIMYIRDVVGWRSGCNMLLGLTCLYQHWDAILGVKGACFPVAKKT